MRPLAVPNEVPLAIMSTELSKDITVVISGEGKQDETCYLVVMAVFFVQHSILIIILMVILDF